MEERRGLSNPCRGVPRAIRLAARRPRPPVTGPARGMATIPMVVVTRRMVGADTEWEGDPRVLRAGAARRLRPQLDRPRVILRRRSSQGPARPDRGAARILHLLGHGGSDLSTGLPLYQP